MPIPTQPCFLQCICEYWKSLLVLPKFHQKVALGQPLWSFTLLYTLTKAVSLCTLSPPPASHTSYTHQARIQGGGARGPCPPPPPQTPHKYEFVWLNNLRQHNSQARIQGRGPCPPPYKILDPPMHIHSTHTYLPPPPTHTHTQP